LPDITELLIGTNPEKADTDNDGIPDGFEMLYGLNPDNSSDGSIDSDNDSVSNLDEYLHNTSPTSLFSAPSELINFKDNSGVNLEISKGWNLKALPVKVYDNINMEQIFNKEGINTIWKWQKNHWLIWSPDKNITGLINSYKIPVLSVIASGEGFWVNASEKMNIKVNGTEEYGLDLVNISSGWNLLGTGKLLTTDDLEILENIKTVWKWSGTGWQIWSPKTSILNLIKSYNLDIANEIKSGEGFWINK